MDLCSGSVFMYHTSSILPTIIIQIYSVAVIGISPPIHHVFNMLIDVYSIWQLSRSNKNRQKMLQFSMFLYSLNKMYIYY